MQMKSSWLRSPLAWSTAASLTAIVATAPILSAQAATKVIAFFVLQSVWVFVLLEIVNCVERYVQQRTTDGSRREPFGMMHALLEKLLIAPASGLNRAFSQ